jgi:hypothetical protein
MAALKKTTTVTSHTFEFTEQEVRDLVAVIGRSTGCTGDVVSPYKVLKSALDQPQEG